MTLSVASNTIFNQNHISRQKAEADPKQTEKSGANPTSESTLSGSKFDDNVTLTQSEKTNAPSMVIDEKTAEKLMAQTMKSILTHGKTAISAQANTIPEIAQEILAEN